MNFSNQFIDVWNSRFPANMQPPQLECLKADQFGSLLDQKQALEYEESKVYAAIEDLKEQLNRETFIADFLHKCIQKLGAVSQVFSEIDQSDSKSSSSSGTAGRHLGSISPPNVLTNGPSLLQSGKGQNSTSNSNFPLFPQCIASNLIQSASPLLVAAAATSTAPFLLPSSLPPFPCGDSIKLDPDGERRSPNFLLSASDRPSSYGAGPRLTTPSSLYSNPFSAGTKYSPSHGSLHSQSSPFEGVNINTNQTTKNADSSRVCDNNVTSEAQAAAAAMAAAFGLGFPGVRTGTSTFDHNTNPLLNFGKDSSINNPGLLQSSCNTHLPPNGLDMKETITDQSISSERPYQCPTCSRSFAVKAGLVQHMRTHTDERPYPCPHCGRAFKQKIQLTTHMRVHSGERPYGCRLCGKLFRQQSHVVQHLRTHTGEKPHKCYQCGKAFRQKYSLISHQRRMCRNRAAANPIAAGMTMWISPGAGGDTCNLVKEFSPTKTTIPITSPTNNSMSTPVSVTASANSPFSPFLSSPVSTAPSSVHQLAQFQSPVNHRDESQREPRLSVTSVDSHSTYRPASHEHDLSSSSADGQEPGPAESEDEELCSPGSSRMGTSSAPPHPTALELS
ncbi:unnamed protein product [Calicophoron daubneyi]|uniref:C2H2-type domain-containing protein n=1 Tax=Calicophoron daubneyi TaxID=300641 RepID=A0AAV2TK99_CALDB